MTRTPRDFLARDIDEQECMMANMPARCGHCHRSGNPIYINEYEEDGVVWIEWTCPRCLKTDRSLPHLLID
ncbi:MAG: hypothetical protein WD066_04820 [Planctomycetaceae bacterium]